MQVATSLDNPNFKPSLCNVVKCTFREKRLQKCMFYAEALKLCRRVAFKVLALVL